jgi:membrane protein YqaA with SNARE-associated domain
VSRLAGRGGIALAGAWGFAEGTLFFIVPDVLISLAALCAGRHALRHVAAAVAGAVLAGGLMFAWATADYPAASAAVSHVPFVRERMFAQADEGLEKEGALALVRGAFTGVPYKIYAVEAPGRMPAATFLLATVPARAARFLLVWAVFAVLGSWIRRQKPGRWSLLAWVHAACWVPFYLVYWSAI